MKLFQKNDEGQTADATEAPKCEHVTLIPRWDSAEDIGHADRVASYRCESCGAEFTLEQSELLRATEQARVQQRLAG